jgi:rSAM/selenodomain-associated transferase 2
MPTACCSVRLIKRLYLIGIRSAVISIIIPVLNEAADLGATLTAIQQATSEKSAVELIVVDGGSQDQTVAIAHAHAIGQSHPIQVLTSPAGRGVQMNAGAKAASGSVLLFLHGDTQVPPNYDQWIAQTLAQAGVVAGAFELAIDAPGWSLRWVEWGVKLRSRLCQLPYGDQAIFLDSQLFWTLGGFPEQPILEDWRLVRQLQQRGRVAIVPVPVLTSGRRWQTLGVFRTTLINQLILLGHGCGVSPEQLKHWYRRLRQ